MKSNEIITATPVGVFLETLKRNNKQIRDDRATALVEDSELAYKRQIEDIEVEIKKLTRDRENMLDLSPDNAFNLKVPTDFNAVEFSMKDIQLGVKIRNLSITLEIAKERYNYLFGG